MLKISDSHQTEMMDYHYLKIRVFALGTMHCLTNFILHAEIQIRKLRRLLDNVYTLGVYLKVCLFPMLCLECLGVNRPTAMI